MTTYSHSALSLYRLCPLRYSLHYEHKLVPLQPPSRHDLDFGAAIDAGLTALYVDGGNLEKAQRAFAASYPEGDYPNPLPKTRGGGVTGKSFANGLAALRGYVKRWHEEDSHWTVLEVQQRHKSDDNGGKDVRLDLVIRDNRDGEVYGLDSKTTGSYLNNDYWQWLQPNSQIRTYTDFIKGKYGHCGGFIINALSFKHRTKAYTPRQGPQKGEQLPAGDWFDFARMVFNPNSDCLELERESFAYWVGRVEADKLSGQWGYNDQSCHAYGRECEYLKLCEVGYSFPRDEELVLSYYRQQCPKVLDEGRCQLGWKHEGEHNATPLAINDFEIAIDEEETENAICD